MASVSSVDSPRQGAQIPQWPPAAEPPTQAGSRCVACAAPLAGDQRYCVECGTRRGALPAAVSRQIADSTGALPLAAMGAAGPTEASAAKPDASDGGAGHGGGRPLAGWAGGLPRFSPSSLAVAVMAMLCFGVVLGAEVSPPSGIGGSIPVRVALSPTPKSQTPQTSATAGSHSGEAATPASTTPGESASTSEGSGTGAAPGAKHGKGSAGQPGSQPTSSGQSSLPPIKHVFLVVLSDQGFAQSFGAGPSAPYLSETLPAQGELIGGYYAVDSGELANEVALISGQGPTADLQEECPLYSEITPGTLGEEAQVIGSGCVYPRGVSSLPTQLESAGKTWKAYIQGIGEGSSAVTPNCAHPALGQTDGDQTPTAARPYVTWRNPFVYFQSLTASPSCVGDDVGLGHLKGDLRSASTTPAFSYIAPDPCDDGAEVPCATGSPDGLAPAEAFLKRVVPEIEASPAYRQGGLIAITFDQAPQSGPHADSSGCCITGAFPNSLRTSSSTTTTGSTSSTSTATTTVGTTTTTAGTTGSGETAGGGRVGLLLISKYVKPGTRELTGQYNHFSLLRSFEDLFALKPLGYAAQPGLLAFDKSVFNAYH